MPRTIATFLSGSISALLRAALRGHEESRRLVRWRGPVPRVRRGAALIPPPVTIPLATSMPCGTPARPAQRGRATSLNRGRLWGLIGVLRSPEARGSLSSGVPRSPVTYARSPALQSNATPREPATLGTPRCSVQGHPARRLRKAGATPSHPPRTPPPPPNEGVSPGKVAAFRAFHRRHSAVLERTWPRRPPEGHRGPREEA